MKAHPDSVHVAAQHLISVTARKYASAEGDNSVPANLRAVAGGGSGMGG